jgi:hypothetical protein
LKSFFLSYPESRRFLTYWSRSLLLTPPGQTTGIGPPPVPVGNLIRLASEAESRNVSIL